MKIEEKRALAQWSEYHRSMLNDVFTDTSLSQAEVDKLRRDLEADPIRWIQHCFPKYAKYPFSKFHISAILRLIEHDEWYEHDGNVRPPLPSTYRAQVLRRLRLRHGGRCDTPTHPS